VAWATFSNTVFEVSFVSSRVRLTSVGDIGVITIDFSPVNALSTEVVAGLAKAIDRFTLVTTAPSTPHERRRHRFYCTHRHRSRLQGALDITELMMKIL